MKDFETNLKRLEELSEKIKQDDISLEDAMSSFEEGIKLSKTLEKDLDALEGKIQILIQDKGNKEDTTKKTTSQKDSKRKSKKPQEPRLALFEEMSQDIQ